MLIKLPRVVIGNDLTGLVIAAQHDAVFIPVSYFQPFAWEFTDEIEFPLITLNRDALRYVTKNKAREDRERLYLHETQEGRNIPKTYYWELERFLISILSINGNVWTDFDIIDCVHNNNTIIFNGKYDKLVVEYKQLWVINPHSSWFRSETSDIKEALRAECGHIMYHVRLNMEGSTDMKGIQVKYDIEDVKDKLFTKIWFNKPFGPKLFMFGNNPKTRTKTVTTKNMTCFIEGVPIDEINDQKYDHGELRRQIWDLFKQHKRIREKPFLFDKFIRKYTLSSEIDKYDDTEDIKFVYFEEKSEIICKESFDTHSWRASFLPILFKDTNSIIRLVSINLSQTKLLL